MGGLSSWFCFETKTQGYPRRFFFGGGGEGGWIGQEEANAAAVRLEHTFN